MVIATDVTERRLLEAQAIRTARFATLGVLAASVAHEINNPNSAIQFNASVLRRTFEDILPILRREAAERGAFLLGGVPVEQAIDGLPRMLEGVLRNSQRIQSIVGNLKHMARQDQGEYDQRVDLPKVLHSAYSILQHQIQKQTDHWELHLPPSLPPLRGNAQQLEQVFINLILNALQSLPFRSSRLWVTAQTEADGAQVCVSLVDQGTGIKEEDLPHLFDPFFTTRPDQGGTGLGLSICQRIIQNHGGTIDISSHPGMGTEVSVRLPVARTTPSEE
jgi:signal transduction histidine kinase